jgi:hypothetical protein
MNDGRPIPEPSLRLGYEVRDARESLIVAVAVVLVLLGGALGVFLWEVSKQVVPEQKAPGASPPVVMPGEAAVNDRVEAIPPPRLDPLEPLEARPPSYRQSRPVPATASPTQRPEDLRADRQPQLQGYGWVQPGKVARIPIGRAMDAVIAAEKGKPAGKKEAAK